MALVAFLLVAGGVSSAVGLAARRTREAEALAIAREELRRGTGGVAPDATLVARGVPSAEVFAAVAQEVGSVLGAEATGILRPLRTGRPAQASSGSHRELVGVYAWVGLSGALGKMSGGGSEPVTTARPGASLPIRAEVHDLVIGVFQQMMDWEDYFRATVGWSPRTPAENGPAMQRAVATLDHGWPLALATAGARGVVSDVLRLRDRAFRLLRWDELVHQMPLPCPRCGLLDLIRRNGEEWVECASCGLYLSGRDYVIEVDRVLHLHAPSLVRSQ